MDGWVIWLIAAVVAAVGEIVTLGFFLAPFAVGALGGMVADLVGLGVAGSFAVFAIATALSFGVVRPIARRHLYTPPHIRTGAAALVGRTAVVVDEINNLEGVGSVRIDGELWTARSLDEDRVIEPGTRVQVVEIRGATALVVP
jgi:membrane protein implicated in regulation of membrane protease activity